ncbi:TMV resistance protein N-like isoform X1 [Vigna radiata var. radiata]|uniref:TMV resistance protein N-like isoform X1 n=1 Tax=Vigna radiata var. radiata TaxID=3916 RepID=A0A1S3VAC9_VIGRR|nr:TMV resistance protein N-like isoform X1 [Vigna radiata var. radiata]
MDIASSSYKLSRKYDVLINFTGEDIHRKFVSHLNSVLSTVGLTTFLHHHNAVKSSHIQEPILSRCRVAIVVFTQTYSQSAWCLNQLQQIINWHETYCRHVLPVYYEIQPSDVRLQKGDFGKALKETAQQTFSRQELEHGMSRWRHALTKAANFFGWDESNHRSDAELVDKIVKSIINLPVLSATKFPVGLQSQVEDLIRTIKNKSNEVYMIGIGGEEGSGKTTLAKAIYNQIHWKFNKKSFIENISQVSDIRGQLRLQEKLLLDVLKQKVEIPNIDVGRSIIRERLSGKRVLIVLDDLPANNELLALWNYSHNWFGEGTVIIITITEFGVMSKCPVDSVFRIKLMNEEESLELLSWHAFREPKPKEEYEDLARRVVSYCGGLPLALEVIGSTLFEKIKEEWNNLLFKFPIAMVDIHTVRETIKVSIEGSLNEIEKDIFLDVCCFFVGESRAYATKILNGCGVDADIGIRVLIQRNLIKINKNNKFGMHPLVQEIGIKIIYENSEKDPGKNRRLWFDKDAKYVPETLQWLPVEPPSVRIAFGEPILNSEYLLKKLRWIRLHGFSSECLPNNSYEDDSTAIDLKRSLLRFLWKTPQVLRSIKVLNLSHSKYLTTTPDFTGLPSLEYLILKYCSRLSKVHQSIGSLNSLILLNLKYCTSLNNLPTEIYDLKSLRTFILSGCSKIDIKDKDIAKLESLITLIAENTAVKLVPFSIVSSKSIGYISLSGFEGLSHNLFPSIIRSWMSPIMNPISYIHFFCMDMEDNTIDIAPLLSTLANIRSVLVACDTDFQLSKQVKNILDEYFPSITESGISKQHLRCSLIGVGAYHQLFNAVNDNIYEVLANSESGEVCLPAVNDPYCLAHMGDGHSVSFIVPEDRYMKGMTLCVVYLSNPEAIEPQFTTVIVINYTKCTFQIHNHGTVISFKDEDWHDIISNLESGDNVEIFVNFGNGLVVKNTTVYLICGESKNLRKAFEPKKHGLIRFVKKVVM